MENKKSIYSQILKPKDASVEKYIGVWNGNLISFSRNFREHRFTDEECEKLLNGESVDIYHLGNHAKYGVRVKLEEVTFEGIHKSYKTVVCKTVMRLCEYSSNGTVPDWMKTIKEVPDLLPEEIRPEIRLDQPDNIDEMYQDIVNVPNIPEVTMSSEHVFDPEDDESVLSEEDKFDSNDFELIEDDEESLFT